MFEIWVWSREKAHGEYYQGILAVSDEDTAAELAELFPESIYFFAKLVPPEPAISWCGLCRLPLVQHTIHVHEVVVEGKKVTRSIGWECPTT